MDLFSSFEMRLLWELTLDIVCYKATFQAMTLKYEYMHTGKYNCTRIWSTSCPSFYTCRDPYGPL